MYWENLIFLIVGAVIATIPWVLNWKNQQHALDLLASRSFSDYSVGAARINKANQKQPNPDNDYPAVWSEESNG
jgi:hypothetical protein